MKSSVICCISIRGLLSPKGVHQDMVIILEENAPSYSMAKNMSYRVETWQGEPGRRLGMQKGWCWWTPEKKDHHHRKHVLEKIDKLLFLRTILSSVCAL